MILVMMLTCLFVQIGVRYIGRVKGGKIFDKNVSGKPFFFALGRQEVIKGWDEGITGMKLGGERKLIIPPALAYGKRGSPPLIPPNATLVFEVSIVVQLSKSITVSLIVQLYR